MEEERLRAVYYARCSTEDENQKDALIRQAAEAEETIRAKGWLLVDAYVESRSGTSRKGRREYNRLYEDLDRNRFDVVVIKSQDRLMRNTRDWYLFADRLNRAGKRLYFYLENTFYSPEDALLTGIKAILAEEYSRELSKKMNLAHQKRQQNNGKPVLTSKSYGYRRTADGAIELIPEEAAVKRRMYELCADGLGGRKIAAVLAAEGVRSRAGKPFSGTDIIRMVRNPMNKGTVVMNRKHYDFNTGKTLPTPPGGQYVYAGKIPAIVSEELWIAANRAADERLCRKKVGKSVQTLLGNPVYPDPLPRCGRIVRHLGQAGKKLHKTPKFGKVGDLTCKGRLDACIIMHDDLKNLQEKRNENGTVMGRTVHKRDRQVSV